MRDFTSSNRSAITFSGRADTKYAGPPNAKDVWIDRAYKKAMKKKIEVIEAFSPEYFALLEDAPELAKCFALGTQVRVVWKKRVIEVRPPKG